MAEVNKVLWVGDTPPPTVLQQASEQRWEIVPVSTSAGQQDLPTDAPLAVIDMNQSHAPLTVQQLQSAGIVSVVLGTNHFELPEGFPVLRVAENVTAEELCARLDTAASLAPTIKRMHDGLLEAEALAKEASRTADEIAEEMQIAQRLQQDFLPRQLPKVGPVRFGVRYLAASFVSGDIYDISRLDETHVGFYVADAVGHGMPAALMTMFIKKALQTKRISGHTYEIIAPEEALAQLNFDLYRQKLSMCEFCTVVYGVIDTESLTCTISRAGHPPPIWVHEDGSHENIDMPGSLLGILEDTKFESRTVQMRPGDRLLVYSDGAEDIICGKGRDKKTEMEKFIEPLTSMDKEDFLARLTVKVPPAGAEDDVTLLLMEVE
ncbi:SpoIIE family protein phosphatase [candidate division KSB3 bacterium]|nr:SpoIIE family protein phosphatase [candidate division KSB3 bacterium]